MENNAELCTKIGDCPAGQRELAPASASSPAECADCVPGEFCDGKTAETCPAGRWDHDQRPSTKCVQAP